MMPPTNPRFSIVPTDEALVPARVETSAAWLLPGARLMKILLIVWY